MTGRGRPPRRMARRQLGQELGVPGIGQVGQIERALGDRVGDQRQRLAAHHGCRRRFDGGDDGRIAAAVPGRDRHRHDGQRIGKCAAPVARGSRPSRSARARRARAPAPAAPADRRRARRLAARRRDALEPAHQRDVGPDARRIAHRHGDRRRRRRRATGGSAVAGRGGHDGAHRYSMCASCRRSRRWRLATISNSFCASSPSRLLALLLVGLDRAPAADGVDLDALGRGRGRQHVAVLGAEQQRPRRLGDAARLDVLQVLVAWRRRPPSPAPAMVLQPPNLRRSASASA